MPRASISLDKHVFDEFSMQASREGKTLFQLTNEWLGLAAKVVAEGGDADTVFKIWRSVTVLREIDSLSLPSDFVDYMVGDLYEQNKSRVLKSFGNLGTNLVGLLKIAAPDLESLAGLAKDFGMFIPIKRFDLEKIGPDTVKINIIGAGKRIESTECSLEFIRAILNGYGYSISSVDMSVGTISLKASKRLAT